MDMTVVALVLTLLLASCTSPKLLLPPGTTEDLASTPVELAHTPFYPQTAHQCGPAALATVLQASGIDVTPDDLVPEVYLPAREGSLQAELVAATRRHDRLPYPIAPEFAALLQELHAGRPVLVLQNLGPRFYPLWHYAVVIGYQPDTGYVILRSGSTERERMYGARFLKTWERAGYWGLVVLQPGKLPARPELRTYLRATADLEAIGQTEAAGKAYTAATRRWPDSTIAWLGLGNTRYNTGDLQAAEYSYRQAIRHAPEHLAAWNNLAETLAQRGCYNAARTTLDTALAQSSTETALHNQLLRTREEILTKIPAGHSRDPAECAEPD